MWRWMNARHSSWACRRISEGMPWYEPPFRRAARSSMLACARHAEAPGPQGEPREAGGLLQGPRVQPQAGAPVVAPTRCARRGQRRAGIGGAPREECAGDRRGRTRPGRAPNGSNRGPVESRGEAVSRFSRRATIDADPLRLHPERTERGTRWARVRGTGIDPPPDGPRRGPPHRLLPADSTIDRARAWTRCQRRVSPQWCRA